jgi:hypothetical protein
MTTVRASHFCRCPFSAAVEFAEQALRRQPNIRVSAVPPIGDTVSLKTRVVDDVTDDARKHDALLLAWQPAHEALFPHFHGALTARPDGPGTCIRIEGSYDPPLGRFGAVFDAVLGRSIARVTIARLLRDITRTVEDRWDAFRAELVV